ncbi:hypothetical protein KC726_03600 [Candidatus Woesebacteria bacterium]|nr:hypothetical protein [Candidatus Woesebacteria bacterium]
MKKTRFRIKIVLAIFVSFFVSSVVVKDVFIASSSTLNPSWKQNLVARINPLHWVQQYQFAQITKELEKVPLQNISQGVYGRETQNASETVIKLGEVDFIEYPIEVDGKTVYVKVPKDQFSQLAR